MCGIAGSIGEVDRVIIQKMTDTMVHRGPDDQGVWQGKGYQVALGHRRLSIIDLSFTGHQPMSYAGGRYLITYNGEVYNFVEIRQNLEHLGHTFHSNSDTEVILAAYSQWGPACLEHFRGMFAFAIWDGQKRELFLARDRFGIKPLLYAKVGNVFLFASELKALLASGIVSRQIDKQAIWDYLSLGSIPQPRTILAQVKALLPGHYMIVRNGNIYIHRYWDIEKQTEAKRNQLAGIAYGDAVAELREQLNEATRYHLIADVPVGAFLSGGIDSTAVVGLMSQLVRHPIKTYSVGFEGQHEKLSELKWAKIAANHFDADHTEVIVTAQDAAQTFNRLIEAIDQPSIDGTNTYFVSQATRQGVTVALSGLGGDELFAGYPQFIRYARSSRVAPNGLPALNHLLAPIGRLLPGRWRIKLESLVGSPIERLSSVRLLMNEKEKKQVTCLDFQHNFDPQGLSEHYHPLLLQEFDPVAQVSYVELSGYMRDTLLRDTDAMSMAHALEVRPVLLDHVFAEFAFSLPATYKLHGQKSKRIFIDALRDLIPQEIVNRQKMGFELPLTDWLGTTLQERASEIFESKSAKKIFLKHFIEDCRRQLIDKKARSQRLWAYVILLEYLELYRLDIDN
jgi:asparagine synthase (glutamine-hydrolysing)